MTWVDLLAYMLAFVHVVSLLSTLCYRWLGCGPSLFVYRVVMTACLGTLMVSNVVTLLLSRSFDRLMWNMSSVFVPLISGWTRLLVNALGLLYRALLRWLELMTTKL